MLKILVTGGTGMLGSALKKSLPYANFLEGRQDIDLSTPTAKKQLGKLPYHDVIIHSAAHTNLPYCEANFESTKHLHADVVPLLQQKCDKLIYISAQGRYYDHAYFKTKFLGEIYTTFRPSDLVIRTNIYGDGGLLRWAVDNLKHNKEINGYSNVMFNPISVTQLASYITTEGLLKSGTVSTGSNTIISKYDFLKVIGLKNNYNLDLIKPVEVITRTDLTVDLSGNSHKVDLLDGIAKLDIQ